MEHICEWPTDMDISVQPGWRESEAAIAGLVFLWIAQGGSPRKAALHCAIAALAIGRIHQSCCWHTPYYILFIDEAGDSGLNNGFTTIVIAYF